MVHVNNGHTVIHIILHNHSDNIVKGEVVEILAEYLRKCKISKSRLLKTRHQMHEQVTCELFYFHTINIEPHLNYFRSHLLYCSKLMYECTLQIV